MAKHPVNRATEATGFQEKLADWITAFSGTMLFAYLHTGFFALWIVSRGFGNDHFPFNFLTMAVSLEAIYLATFVLISQNRATARDRLTLEHEAQETEELLALQKTQLEILNAIKQETAALQAIQAALNITARGGA